MTKAISIPQEIPSILGALFQEPGTRTKDFFYCTTRLNETSLDQLYIYCQNHQAMFEEIAKAWKDIIFDS